MTFRGDDPKPELTTERVPGGRRAAAIVAVVAIVVVGTLVWKPWDTGAPAATPAASFLVAAAGIPSPSTPVSSPDGTPAPVPYADPPPPLVQPEPPVDVATDLMFPSASGLGEVTFNATGGPTVHCLYKSAAAGSRSRLTSMIADSPIIFPSLSSLAHKVAWRVEVEANTQDKIFEADWQLVGRSKAKEAKFDGPAPAAFDPIFVKVPPADSITLYRVTLLVDWLDARGRTLETQQIHPTTYGPLGNANAPLGPGGCAAAV